jgi:hypothetical protein
MQTALLVVEFKEVLPEKLSLQYILGEKRCRMDVVTIFTLSTGRFLKLFARAQFYRMHWSRCYHFSLVVTFAQIVGSVIYVKCK